MDAPRSTHLRPPHVRAVRAFTVWTARIIAIAMITTGLIGVGERLMYGFSIGDVTSAWRVFVGIGEAHGIYRGLPLVTVGAALGLAARPLARWAIPLPDRGCPACAHAATTEDGICTECGLPDA